MIVQCALLKCYAILGTETVLLIFPFLQTNITVQMRRREDRGLNKARFPLPKLTAVNSASGNVRPSTRVMETGHTRQLGPLTRVVNTGSGKRALARRQKFGQRTAIVNQRLSHQGATAINTGENDQFISHSEGQWMRSIDSVKRLSSDQYNASLIRFAASALIASPASSVKCPRNAIDTAAAASPIRRSHTTVTPSAMTFSSNAQLQ